MYPYVTWDIIPDWGELSKVVSGISPDHQYVNRPGSPTDPMTDKWDRETVVDAYSEFNKMAHDLDMAIHPWPLQDDRLVYKKKLNQYHETKLYVVKGCDGFFAEFPIDTYRWFEDLGNHSTLDFEHPAHDLESKDLNLEVLKKCIADRYRKFCMSNETLFGKTELRDIFLGPRLRPWVKNYNE